jgi:hypothetical protein
MEFMSVATVMFLGIFLLVCTTGSVVAANGIATVNEWRRKR